MTQERIGDDVAVQLRRRMDSVSLGRAARWRAAVVVGLVWAVSPAARATAQITPAPAPPTAPRAAPSAAVLDTTIRPGHQDLRAYDTPSRCLAMAQQVAARETRAADAWLDTATYDPLRRHSPTAAIAVARAQCGHAFPVEAAPRDELPALLQLALLAGDDTTAHAAAERWLQLKGSDTTMARRGWFLLDVMSMYLSARPMRLAQAESLLAKVDALGPVAEPARLIAHTVVFHDVVARFDTARLEREALAVAALEGKLNDSTDPASVRRRDGVPVVRIQREHLNLGSVPDDGVVPIVLLFSILYRTSTPAEAQAEWARVAASLKAMRYFASEQEYNGAIQFVDGYFAAMREPIPAVRIPYWFGAAGPHTWPVPGKVNVAIDFASSAEGPENYPWYAMIRRLHEKFGDKVVITLFAYTRGYRREGPMTSAKEAEWLRDYFLDYLKLPANLAVDTTVATKLPDGRVVRSEPAYQHLRLTGLTGTVRPPQLVDQHGYGYIVPSYWPEATLDAFVRRLLARGGR